MPKSILSPAGLVYLFLALATAQASVVSDTTLMTGLTGSAPTGLAVAGDGRVFVIQQNGQVKLYDNGATSTLSVSLTNLNLGGGERGLIGIALDPSDNSNVFLHYTSDALGGVVNRVSRYNLAGTTLSLLNDVFLSEPGNGFNHRGGGLAFGADGKLYAGVGDMENPLAAQNGADAAGSIVQLDTLTAVGAHVLYAQGVRNPFVVNVQPGTGLMFINDVGSTTFEEINSLAAGTPAGTNFGWPLCEGPCGVPGMTDPLFHYANDGDTCAITGGAFYNPGSPDALITGVGQYLYTDYCTGKFHSLDFSGAPVSTEIYTRGNTARITALATAANGNVYYLDAASGTLGELTAVPEPASWGLMAVALGAAGWWRRRQPYVRAQ